MIVADLMQANIKSTVAEATIADAIVTLADAHVSALPVVDVKNRLIGVLSTSDILEAEAECEDADQRERMFSETLVKDIMTPRPATIPPDGDIREAAQQMLYLEIHRLFVEDE